MWRCLVGFRHKGVALPKPEALRADREASNELFSNEKEIHEHANTVGDYFPQHVRSSWFGGLLRWRARTSCHTESGCDRNACANTHPVSNLCAGQHSAPVRRKRCRIRRWRAGACCGASSNASTLYAQPQKRPAPRVTSQRCLVVSPILPIPRELKFIQRLAR